MIAVFNALVLMALAGALLAVILHPRIKDGVIIKAGLMAMTAGCITTALGQVAPGILHANRSLFLLLAGLCVVACGYWLRTSSAQPARRASDWVTGTDRASHR